MRCSEILLGQGGWRVLQGAGDAGEGFGRLEEEVSAHLEVLEPAFPDVQVGDNQLPARGSLRVVPLVNSPRTQLTTR